MHASDEWARGQARVHAPWMERFGVTQPPRLLQQVRALHPFHLVARAAPSTGLLDVARRPRRRSAARMQAGGSRESEPMPPRTPSL